jgi:integrase
MLSEAVEHERLPANPALQLGWYLRRGDEPKPQIQPLTRAEAAHLVAVAKEHFSRWHPFVLCALRTGCRLGELLALQYRDIDWNGRFLVVDRNLVCGVVTTPKSHQRRRVDVSAQLAAVLLEWRRSQTSASAEEGHAAASVGLPIARRHGARRTQRASCLQAAAGEGRASAHSRARPAAHVCVIAASAGRVHRVRQGATRPRVDPDHGGHVWASDPWRESCGGGPVR